MEAFSTRCVNLSQPFNAEFFLYLITQIETWPLIPLHVEDKKLQYNNLLLKLIYNQIPNKIISAQ